MLTRRHIRIKVMQSVYSFNLGQQNKLEQEVLFFKESVDQTFNLYLLLLGLLKALQAHAEDQLEIIEKNKIQNESQSNILKTFSKNRVLIFLKDHEVLAKQLQPIALTFYGRAVTKALILFLLINLNGVCPLHSTH